MARLIQRPLRNRLSPAAVACPNSHTLRRFACLCRVAQERMGISSPRAVSPRVPEPTAPTAVAVKVVQVETGKAY